MSVVRENLIKRKIFTIKRLINASGELHLKDITGLRNRLIRSIEIKTDNTIRFVFPESFAEIFEVSGKHQEDDNYDYIEFDRAISFDAGLDGYFEVTSNIELKITNPSTSTAKVYIFVIYNAEG